MCHTSKNNSVFRAMLLLAGLLTLYLILCNIVPLYLPSPHPNRLKDITNKFGSCKWQTQDGSVVMWVDREMVDGEENVEYAFGTISLNGECVPVYFRFAWDRLNIIPITFFDGETFEPEWDYIAPSHIASDWRTKYAKGSKKIRVEIRKRNDESVEWTCTLPDEWTLYLTEEGILKDDIEYPQICFPEYYGLYLQYEDVFAEKMTYTAFFDKYGICDVYLPYNYDPNSSILPTWGEYVVQRNEFGEPIYYIAFSVLNDGNIYNPVLVRTPETSANKNNKK